jgi:hypothetical protein
VTAKPHGTARCLDLHKNGAWLRPLKSTPSQHTTNTNTCILSCAQATARAQVPQYLRLLLDTVGGCFQPTLLHCSPRGSLPCLQASQPPMKCCSPTLPPRRCSQPSHFRKPLLSTPFHSSHLGFGSRKQSIHPHEPSTTACSAAVDCLVVCLDCVDNLLVLPALRSVVDTQGVPGACSMSKKQPAATGR